MPSTSRSSLVGLLAAAALLVHPLPALAGPALPDWDAAKPKKKPADLPDWDAAKPKKDPKQPGKPKKPKKPGEPAPTETPGETPPVEATPTETPPAETAPPPVETPPPAEATPVAPPAEPAKPVAEGPEPAPTPAKPDARAVRVARGEVISGAVLIGLGLGGFGALAGGVLIKNSAEEAVADDPTDADAIDRVNTGTTMLAAGAIVGVIGTIMGVALLGDGLKDRKAARPKEVARVRVGPTFGGLTLRGRF